MKEPPQSVLLGQAGVWRVASKLAVLGINPLFPGIDHGYDLSTESGCRIQVKTTGLRKNRVYPEGAYWFKFWQSNILGSANTIRKRGARDYSLCSDMMVLWGRDEDRFWIFPSPVLATTQCLTVGPKGFYQRYEFAEAKRLSADGLSQQEIADKLGISQPGVSYQLRGGRAKQPAETMSAKARRYYEDRWCLVIDFGKTTSVDMPGASR